MNDQEKEQFQNLETKVESIQSSLLGIENEKESNYQLTFPLDVQSAKIIRSQAIIPVTATLKNTEPQTAANYGIFFLADRPFVVDSVAVIWGTAGSASATLNIEKLIGTEAVGSSGRVLLNANLSLTTTANTVAYPRLINSSDKLVVQRGQRLALSTGGTLTALKDLHVTVFLALL